jgi:formylglycine-generating enzyme required for sulfatase activity
MRAITTLGVLAVCVSASLGNDPAYYQRKSTWQETLRVSREALSAWEAKESGKDAPKSGGEAELGPFYEIGPFKANGGSSFEAVFEPEKEIDLGKSYGRLRWKLIQDADGQGHDRQCPGDAAIYFYRKIIASRDMKLPTWYGSDDGLAVWCNGRKVLSEKVDRGLGADQNHCVLELGKGENHLLIKIWNNSGACGYYFSTTGGGNGQAKANPPAVRRKELWGLIERDFTEPGARREMAWEQADGVWNADWQAGKLADLAGRYVNPVRGLKAGEQIESAAKAVTAPPGLDKVRQLYYGAKRLQEAMASIKEVDPKPLRLAIRDLVRTYGGKYPRGEEFLRRLDAVEQAVAEAAGSKDVDQGKLVSAVEKFNALRQEALLANPLLDFDKLLLIKRRGHLGLPQNWQGNCSLPRSGFDNEIDVLSPVSPAGTLTTLYRPERPVFVGDVELHFDAGKMLFSSVDERNRWQVYEIDSNGKDLRQVTPAEPKDVDNYDAVYLPDERIIFDSTRFCQGVPCVGGADQVANLFLINADRDPASIRQLTFEQDHDWYPTLLHDGRVMYTRWEYSDSPHYFTRILFSMNPDGTDQIEQYGSNSYWPNSMFYARPCPGHPTKFVAVISGHHGVPRMGELIVFDPAKGKHEADGVVQRIPGYGKPVEPIIRDGLVDGSWPKFLHPWPLSDKYFLVSCQPTPRDPWAIYLVDVFDNMLKLASAPDAAMMEPVPLKKTARPPGIPDRVDLSRKDAVMYIQDIYAGPGLSGVPRGSVKALRLYAFHYAYTGMGGHINVGIDGPWDVHRILGTVPVKPDGSAMFRVPANTPMALQPLDENGMAMQVMRSWVTAMPGEFKSCVGCHERQADVAGVAYAAAAGKVEQIRPWRGEARGFSFIREVQPVLDKYCVGCHDGTPSKSGQPKPDLRVDGSARFGNFTPSYVALHGYVRRPGPESDYHLQAPMEFHANTSELIQMLRKGHHGVKLNAEAWDRLITWIDLNVPDKGTWGEHRRVNEQAHDRRQATAKAYAQLTYDPEAIVPTELGDMAPVKPAPPAPPRPSDVTAPGWPFDAAEAARRQTAAAAQLGAAKGAMSVDLAPGVKLDMVLIPAGEFVMGDANGWPDEQTQTRVAVAKPFWMGKLEVTNQQYGLFDPLHDSGYISVYKKDHNNRGEAVNDPTQPVVRVSWTRARDFCRWLSERTGAKFDLPSEAQWEYACRAGTATAMNYGDVKADFARLANFADQRVNAISRGGPEWIPCIAGVNDGASVTTNGGRYAPNAWGLCDMHGNASEWTRSNYRPYPYNAADGREDVNDDGRKVVRGGSFYDRPKAGRSGFRLDYPAWQRVYNVGFRVICQPGPNGVAAAQGMK